MGKWGKMFADQIFGSGKKSYNPRHNNANKSFYKRFDAGVKRGKGDYAKAKNRASRNGWRHP